MHEDRQPSFAVNLATGLWRCYGCGAKGNAVQFLVALKGIEPDQAKAEVARLTGQERHPRPQKKKAARKADKADTALPGLTLEELAQAKQLPVELLAAAGCRNSRRNGGSAVTIPYADEGGTLRAVRSRLALGGALRFLWRRGDKVMLYGLPRLKEAREAGWVLLVEGESDVWTAWHHGLPALGMPGKATWRPEWAAHLTGLDVLLWQEPDAADAVGRLARDLPELRVIAPEGIKDISEAHCQGLDVLALIAELRAKARPARELLREQGDARLGELRQAAAPVLAAPDPLDLVKAALRAGGYGGDLRPAVIVYLAATSRLLAMRSGAMPVHLLLIGPPSAGKSYTVSSVLRLLPPEACHVIAAGSPRVLIYDTAELAHRVLLFGEADSLPAGEDNPAASAIRNLLQDNRLHYKATIKDPDTGDFTVRDIEKPGPTVLITTATRRLGEQLDSRLFSLEVPDDQIQVREALLTQASLEVGGIRPPDEALLAYQAYLQALAPWRVIVPFARPLAKAIGSNPAATRIVRDFARLLSLIKAAALLRQEHRGRDERGRILADIADYATVRELVGDLYQASVTGCGEKIRAVVTAVSELRKAGLERVRNEDVRQRLGLNKMAVSRRVRAAIRGGWLVNKEVQKGHPYNLDLGEPLPAEEGLPLPEDVSGNTVTAPTERNGCTCCAETGPVVGRGDHSGNPVTASVEKEGAPSCPDSGANECGDSGESPSADREDGTSLPTGDGPGDHGGNTVTATTPRTDSPIPLLADVAGAVLESPGEEAVKAAYRNPPRLWTPETDQEWQASLNPAGRVVWFII